MSNKNVTSYDQKGGITAFEMNAGDDSRGWKNLPIWVQWLVAIATVFAAIAAIVFGILQII